MTRDLKKASKGETVIIPTCELFINYDRNEGFASEADLQNWCDVFGLQFEYLSATQSYKISKLN